MAAANLARSLPIKPIILLIPGSWHYPSHYTIFSAALVRAGYLTEAVDLPSNGAHPQPNFAADVATIRAAITRLASTGADIVLFMHSYGSVPAYNATRGLDKRTRAAANLPGGVTSMIFCAACIVPIGFSIFSAYGGEETPWFQADEAKEFVRPITPESTFYNDLPEDVQRENVKALGPFSYQCYNSKVEYEGFRDVDCVYVYTTQDMAISLPVQQLMVESATKGDAGKNWKTVVLDAGHCPFISRVDEVVAVVEGLGS